jgi:hypothetical protein
MKHEMFSAMLADMVVKKLEPYRALMPTGFMKPVGLAFFTDDVIAKQITEEGLASGYHREDVAAVSTFCRENKERVYDALVEALNDPLRNTALIECFEEALAA